MIQPTDVYKNEIERLKQGWTPEGFPVCYKNELALRINNFSKAIFKLFLSLAIGTVALYSMVHLTPILLLAAIPATLSIVALAAAIFSTQLANRITETLIRRFKNEGYPQDCPVESLLSQAGLIRMALDNHPEIAELRFEGLDKVYFGDIVDAAGHIFPEGREFKVVVKNIKGIVFDNAIIGSDNYPISRCTVQTPQKNLNLQLDFDSDNTLTITQVLP